MPKSNQERSEPIDAEVLGQRLADARRARGVTQQQAAMVLNVARTTVTAMERGVRTPRPSELLTLAGLYGRQVGDFVRPRLTGDTESFVVHFRTRGGRDDAIADQARAADSLRFEDLCRWYVELEQLLGAPLARRYPEIYDVSQTLPERAAEEVAISERNRLGLGDGPIGDIPGLLETDVGLRVFSFRMTSDLVAGLYYYSDTFGGCIAVNTSHSEERRRRSIARHYGHFLTDRPKPRITHGDGARRHSDDRFADAFADVFLLPASGLARRFQAMRRAKVEPVTTADLLALSHLYGVSLRTLTRRLENMDLLPKDPWHDLDRRGSESRNAAASGASSRADHQTPLLPRRYELLATQAFERELITEGELARMLGTDRVSARERIHAIAEEIELDDNDARHRVPLEIGTTLAGIRG